MGIELSIVPTRRDISSKCGFDGGRGFIGPDYEDYPAKICGSEPAVDSGNCVMRL